MKLFFAALFLLSLLCSALARPQYKDIDYKLYQEREDGVAIDAVFEMVKPPDEKIPHHHHHHKKMSKTNRLERLKRFLEGYDRL